MVIEYGQYSDIGGHSGTFDLPTYGKPGLTAQGKICHMWVGGSYPVVKKHCNVITRQKHLQSRSDNIYIMLQMKQILFDVWKY